MLRGVYRELVTVKIKNHRLYEEAIFILKEKSDKKLDESELFFEANRILCESGVKSPKKRKGKALKKLLFSSIIFILGIIFGIFCYAIGEALIIK